MEGSGFTAGIAVTRSGLWRLPLVLRRRACDRRTDDYTDPSGARRDRRDPVERLADASRDLDVLVIGSRRFGPVRSVLLGSVSWPLIERAACPVLVVPRGVHADAFDETAAHDVAHA